MAARNWNWTGKNTEFVWDLRKTGFFLKAAVSRAVRLRECPLGELPHRLYCSNVPKVQFLMALTKRADRSTTDSQKNRWQYDLKARGDCNIDTKCYVQSFNSSKRYSITLLPVIYLPKF